MNGITMYNKRIYQPRREFYTNEILAQWHFFHQLIKQKVSHCLSREIVS